MTALFSASTRPSLALVVCLEATLAWGTLACASMSSTNVGRTESNNFSSGTSKGTGKSRAATGIFHQVKAGETLWKISRAYEVSIEDIVIANELSAANSISVGQRLFIPGATAEISNDQKAKQVAVSKSATSTKAARTPTPPVAAKSQASPSPKKAETPAGSWKAMADDEGRVSAFNDAEQSNASRSDKSSKPFLPMDETVSNQYVPKAGTKDKPLNWPVRGVIYAKFGKRGQSVHDGIDIAAPEATPIRTAAAGTVIFSAMQPGYGNTVILEHGGNILTIYAHNRENLVKEGDKVRAGQVIARMGKGTETSGPYLHFEVRVGGEPKDPLKFLPPPK